MKFKELYEYNKLIYENDIYTSKLRLSLMLMPGFFNDNKIMFICQNPGQPSATDTHQNQKMNFYDHQIDYFKGFLKCRIGIYLKTILSQLGLNVFDIGFTNIVKYSTINNIQPTINEANIMIPILKKQIELLIPEKIVAVGAFASYRLSENNIMHKRIKHPASHNYSFFKIAKDVEIIK